MSIALNPALVFKPEEFLGPGWGIDHGVFLEPIKRLGPSNIELVEVITDVERLSQIPVSPEKRRLRLIKQGRRPLGARELLVMLSWETFFPPLLKERTPTGRPLTALVLDPILRSPGGATYVLTVQWWETRFSPGRWECHYLPSEYLTEYIPLTVLVYKD